MNSSLRYSRIGGGVITVMALITACAQTPKLKPPLQLEQAERHNLQGIAAESRQKFVAAESEFMESYRLYRSVEHYLGMGTALINSSRLYRRQGDYTNTEQVLKQAVGILSQTPELEAEICFEMTKLALAKGDLDAAAIWSARGVKSAAGPDRGRMLNLQAVTAIQQTAPFKAQNLAGLALTASRGSADRREEANALRILGDIAFTGNNFREAQEMYASALSIDKDLALSIRISDDLRGIARSYAAAGDLVPAADHYQRSAAINIAERDFNRGVADLEKLQQVLELANNRERLAEISELLEKIKHPEASPFDR